MIHKITWTDQQGVERSVFSDDKESATQVQNAMRADRRICVIAPSVNAMELNDVEKENT